ncbi:MAG: hypothetical protein ABIL58_18635 [Pseudomonadota bacterium]
MGNLTSEQCLYDGIFEWEGYGGAFKLASGKCYLKVYDLTRGSQSPVAVLKPVIVLAMDMPDSPMSVRSCIGHIATRVVTDHGISPARTLFVEYYPAIHYGEHGERHIARRFEAVDFEWHGYRALFPKWRTVPLPLLTVIAPLTAGWPEVSDG